MKKPKRHVFMGSQTICGHKPNDANNIYVVNPAYILGAFGVDKHNICKKCAKMYFNDTNNILDAYYSFQGWVETHSR